MAAAVTDAHQARRHEEAWRLCAALHTQVETATDPQGWITVLEVGVNATRHCGQLPLALVSSMLGRCLMRAGDLARADDVLAGAEHRWQSLSQPRGQACTTQALGDVALLGGDAGLAEARFWRALALYAELGDERGIWRIRYLLGQTYLVQHRYGRAAQYLDDARSWYADHGDQARALAAARALERAHRCQGRRDRELRARSGAQSGLTEAVATFQNERCAAVTQSSSDVMARAPQVGREMTD
jgi:tetratricopeptide (TPR) repeat protein